MSSVGSSVGPTVGPTVGETALGPPLYVRGVVLPGDEHRDLWVRNGRVTYEPVPGAETVASGWVLPGLVDLHCHVGLDAHGAVPDDEAERQALTDRDAGVLLLRDAG